MSFEDGEVDFRVGLGRKMVERVLTGLKWKERRRSEMRRPGGR